MARSSDPSLRFREEVPSTTGELHRLRGVVEREAVRVGFDPETAFRMSLAVDEACSNIIRHSYRNNPAEQFTVEITVDDDHFIIHLIDHGTTYDPSNAGHFDRDAYLNAMRPGGLGLHIIRMVMDDVSYETIGERNHLRLVKRLPE